MQWRVKKIIFSAKLFRLATASGRGSGQLSDLNEVLSNDYGSLPNITFLCNYDRQNKHSSWQWMYDNRKYSVLPKCSVGCREQPPRAIPPNVTRVWKNLNYWDHSLDSKRLLNSDIPTYKCGTGKYECRPDHLIRSCFLFDFKFVICRIEVPIIHLLY